MFVRLNRDNREPEEIEMEEFPSQRSLIANLKNINFNFPVKVISTMNFKLNLDDFNRTPQNSFTNADVENETKSLIGQLPDDIWVKIFSYLDVPTIISLMISCKKMANLANDDETKGRLRSYQTVLLFKPKPTPTESFFDRNSDLLSTLYRMPPNVSAHQLVSIHQDQQVYNDGPPGQGFIMRNN